MVDREEDDFERFLAEQLQDPEFREIWEADEAEYQMRCAIIQARIETGMTQQQLAEAIGMNQRAISRIEMGNTNPTVRTLGRIARGFGKKLQIRFV
ncbi:helix-turn-helix transcriptional regulator [Eggerthella sinensis]|uniref:helix-turn-helix transcriptional regulator n=1 Tax=Eggerthella sinensis TaxID=242230 RepID=UPI00266C06F3|nr:helix-turn-helix transcriptional regulator [Eggerthella sinensis]